MSRRGYPVSTSTYESCSFSLAYADGHVEVYPQGVSYTDHAADKVGGNTPGWPGHSQENSYTAWSIDTHVTSASFRSYNTSVNNTGSGTWPFIYISGITNPEAGFSEFGYVKQIARDLCISQLVTAAKDQKVNGLLVAAELHKTAGTISSVARRLASAYTAVRNRNISGALNVLLGGSAGRAGKGIPPNSGSAAKDWLAIQYGWKPLLSDVYGAAEELARSTTYQAPARKVTGHGKHEDTVSYRTASTVYYSPTCTVTRSYRATAKGVIEYGVGSQMAATAANTGITNPLSVIWELVPYSFVVDWFLPVGNYLNNLDYDNGLIFNKGHIVIKTEGKWTAVSNNDVSGQGPDHVTLSGGSQRCTGTSYEREVLLGFPSVPTPHFKNPVSLGHAANALALLRVAFSGSNYYR